MLLILKEKSKQPLQFHTATDHKLVLVLSILQGHPCSFSSDNHLRVDVIFIFFFDMGNEGLKRRSCQILYIQKIQSYASQVSVFKGDNEFDFFFNAVCEIHV